jgi:hypothetical protein
MKSASVRVCSVCSVCMCVFTRMCVYGAGPEPELHGPRERVQRMRARAPEV